MGRNHVKHVIRYEVCLLRRFGREEIHPVPQGRATCCRKSPTRMWLRPKMRRHRLLVQVFGFKDVGLQGALTFLRKLSGHRERMPSCLARAVTRCRRLFPRECADARHARARTAHPTTTSQGGSMMRYFLTTTCLGAAAMFAIGTANANDELIKLQQDAKQWVMPTGNYANQRYSQLKQITAENVGKLQVAWTFSTGVLRGHEGGPLVIGNVMYVHTPFPNNVFALDLNAEGKILWKYEPKQDPNVIPVMCCDTVNRGPSYADGKILLHQADTTLVALDAKTGNVAWSVKNGDPAKGETGTSSPMVFKDKVIVGISGGEFGVRGSVTAYNIKDGKQVWRAYSMGPDSDTLLDPQKTTHLGKPVGPNSGTNTWQGEQWKIGGGTTWGWYSYDPELNLFYYGSGNPSTWNPKQRPGDNRWSMTIFARDVDTGQARWVYQMTPHDEWDYDGVNEMILADQQVGGQ